MVVKEYPYAVISIFKDRSIGKVEWKDRCTSEEYRNTFKKLLEIQAEHSILRFVSDVRNQSIISPDDRKWFEAEAMPAAINQGLVAAAVIFNGNVFKKYYLNLILQAINKFGLPFKIFNEPEPAENWLMKYG